MLTCDTEAAKVVGKASIGFGILVNGFFIAKDGVNLARGKISGEKFKRCDMSVASILKL